MKPYSWGLLTAILILSGLSQQNLLADDISNNVKALNSLKSANRFKDAIILIQNQLRQPGLPYADKLRLQIELAGLYRLDKQPNVALQTLSSLNKADQFSAAAALEYAKCYSLLKNQEGASRNLAIASASGNPLIRMAACLELARNKFHSAQYEECIRYCQSTIDDFAALSSYEAERDSDSKRIFNEAKKLLDQARAMLQQTRYGDDFIHYKNGRIAQSSGDYERAIEHYRKIRTPVLSDAAGCYIPMCLSKLGRTSDAVTAYEHFITNNKHGLYREEARLELIRLKALYAVSSQDFKNAEVLLHNTLKWRDGLLENMPDTDLDSVRYIIRDFPAPAHYVVNNQMGTWYRSKVKPENIINRLTAKWYSTHIEAQTYLIGIYIKSQTKDVSGMNELLDKLSKLNDDADKKLLATYESMDRVSKWASRGHFIIPTWEWNRLGNFEGAVIRMGFFYLAANDAEHARNLFNEVNSRIKDHPIDTNTWALLHIGLSLCEFISGNHPKAVQQLSRFDTLFRETNSRPLALLLRANMLSGMSEKDYKSAQLQYEAIVSEYSKTPYVPLAMISSALSAANRGDKTLASSKCLQLIVHYPETNYARSASSLMLAIGADPTQARRVSPSLRKLPIPGKSTPLEYSLTFPGPLIKRVDYTKLGAADIIKARLTANTRNACIKLTSFRIIFSEFEPQIPGRDDMKCEYIEIPLLRQGI